MSEFIISPNFFKRGYMKLKLFTGFLFLLLGCYYFQSKGIILNAKGLSLVAIGQSEPQ